MRALYAIPQFFKYYEEQGDLFIIPRGCITLVIPLLGKFEYTDETVEQPLVEKFCSVQGFALREYQEGVPEDIASNTEGVIKLGTGFGKTLISLKLVENIQQKTLIIVHRRAIFDQFVEESKIWFDYDIGQIAGTKFDVKDVTVAMIDTLSKRDYESLGKKFGCVIVDECHNFITDKREKVITSFNCKYLYGMSGTPERSDGKTNAIEFVFGRIVVDEELPQDKPEVITYHTDVPILMSDNYHEMVDDQVDSLQRNTLIYAIAISMVDKGRKVLILTKRIKHNEILKGYLDSKGGIYSISSKDKDDDRSKLLSDLRNDKCDYNVLLGTFSLLSTGINIPSLDTLIIAGDLKSNILTGQSAGRILRLFDDKKHPLIIDFDDNKHGIFHRQFLARRRFYKDKGWLDHNKLI